MLGFFRKTGQPTWILAFLGNPGKKYESTRHNAGFMAADALCSERGLKINTLKWNALTSVADLGGAKVLLMKPQTLMNLSGDAIQPAAAFYRIPPERVLVICDDVALPLGKIRVKRHGSAGGHNGLKSIISRLGTDEFPRIKIGVGEPPEGPEHDMIDWVIGHISAAEAKEIGLSAKRAVEAAEAVISEGPDAAMNKFN